MKADGLNAWLQLAARSWTAYIEKSRGVMLHCEVRCRVHRGRLGCGINCWYNDITVIVLRCGYCPEIINCARRSSRFRRKTTTTVETNFNPNPNQTQPSKTQTSKTPPFFDLCLISDLGLVPDLYPMSPHQHFVFNLKSYASVSQRARTIHQPTSSLVCSTREIASKEE